MTMIGSPVNTRGGAAAGILRAPHHSDPASLSDALMGLSVSVSLSEPKLWQRRAAASTTSSGHAAHQVQEASPPSTSYLGCLLPPPEARGLFVNANADDDDDDRKPSSDRGSGGEGAGTHSQPGNTACGIPSGLNYPRGDLNSTSGQTIRPIEIPKASTTSYFAAASAASASPDVGRLYSRIRQELGKGEGVTALLERSRKSGSLVVASEDDADADAPSGSGPRLLPPPPPCSSNDEAGGGDLAGGGFPMSPTTRLRRDTFGATLDFIEALCDASSSLASFAQVPSAPLSPPSFSSLF
jgi:hypothetical protein